MRRLLILTGPQGSGNHLFSKIFALHQDVYGWKTLLNTYWEGHHHEPFAKHWQNPELLRDFDWDQSDYYVTSVSCPYFKDGVPHIPDYMEFIETCYDLVDYVSVAVIGRDSNILEYQQERVRGAHTTPLFLDRVEDFLEAGVDINFVSQELLYLYRSVYLEKLSLELDFPIAHWDPDVEEILKQDANRKYIKRAHEYWLDHEVAKAVRES